jgi:TolB-like protein
MTKLTLELLGGFRLQTDAGEPVPLTTRKAQALLAYLALHPGQAHVRPKLATLFWGDRGEGQARDSLRQALSLVRKALSGVRVQPLIAHEDSVTLVPMALNVDAIAFEGLIEQQRPESLREAVGLYRGELLDGFQVPAPEFESWATVERQRLRERALEAMAKLLDHYLASGAVERGIHIAMRVLTVDPLQERVHRNLMELYRRQGRYGSALRQYRTCTELFSKELGIEPDVQTKALRRDILRKWNRREDEASSRDAPLPDKPSLAVLPFENMTGDAEQEYFVDGMVEEIITALSRIRQLFVIARNSSFAYKGQAVDIKQIGRELGVHYVLEGSVRKAGKRIRITGQLIDAISGAHLWADRFDGLLKDVFELQDSVASSVAGAIEPTLQAAALQQSAQRRTDDLTAYDLYLRARASALSWEKLGVQRALDALGKVLERDPHYAPALALVAHCHIQLHLNGWSDNPEKGRQKGIEYARRALRIGGDDPDVLGQVAFVLGYFERDINPAIALIDRALELNPSHAIGWERSGYLRLWNGQADLAIEHFERSFRLNPRGRAPSFETGVAHFFARRLDKAAALLLLPLQEIPNWPPTYRFLASCYAHMGRFHDAHDMVKRLREITPVVIPSVEHLRIPKDREFYLGGLRLAARETQ